MKGGMYNDKLQLCQIKKQEQLN